MSEDATREAIRQICDQNGPHWVRSVMNDRSDGFQAQCMREWIYEYESNERAEVEAEQRRISLEAVRAAQISAEISSEAALASKTSARWTMVAAIAAALGTLVTAVGTAITAAQALHWLK
jgi:ferric-dicitrate binding protein FerR (iron transport regulator)